VLFNISGETYWAVPTNEFFRGLREEVEASATYNSNHSVDIHERIKELKDTNKEF